MSDYVTSVTAIGVHGRFDLKQDFQPGVNIIYGKNGTGKTTFLHILANVLNGDYNRFVFLAFKYVEVVFNDGASVVVKKEAVEQDNRITVTLNKEPIYSYLESEIRHTRRRLPRHITTGLLETTVEEKSIEPLLPTDYFPAFRTMIEAWASVQEENAPARNRSEDRQIKATHLARQLFGKFVPQINYPSPIEIEQRLSVEVRRALFSVSMGDQELLSRAFLNIFAALFSDTNTTTEPPEMILDQIKSLSENLESSPVPAGYFSTPIGIYDQLKQQISSLKVRDEVEQSVIRILDVYRDILAKRSSVQRAAFTDIYKYLDAVNGFLEGKSIETRLKEEVLRVDDLVRVVFDDGDTGGLETLSSGERQIVTLIYAATHMNKQRVVLIDEPELSLHVDWQRSLLNIMSEQLQDRQIIACTHSPVIAADYKGHMKELTLRRTELPEHQIDQM